MDLLWGLEKNFREVYINSKKSADQVFNSNVDSLGNSLSNSGIDLSNFKNLFSNNGVIFNKTNSNIFETQNNININTDSIYNGIDWLYTSVETVYAYDYKILYFWLLNNIYDESIDFFFLSIWFLTLSTEGLQLFWSVMLDNYISNSLFNFSLTDEWFRGFISSKDSALFVIHHPELLFVKNQIVNNFFSNFLTDVNITILQYLDTQSLLTPIMLFPQLLFVGYVAFFFVSFYFSFYTNYTKEESTIDADYLNASTTIESEKEIGSVDDILMPSIVFIYTFGWYFYLHCWTILCSMPEFILVIFFFPLLYYTIANIPTFLLNDFGILYFSYLRGVAPSPSLVFELMYDYIAVIAFYVRILTQGVRLALMFFAYAGMHDYVLYMDYSHVFLNGNESIWEDISNINGSLSSFTYFFLGVFPGHIVNWLYEVYHTFFVITGQIVAYFAMIFWLFLFLFTFFVIEKQEDYFFERRKFRQDLLKKIRNINTQNKG